ncbi:MAG: bifunctional DNA-formamidopyrimidine glycosylase/DNA-(apurinic or apyrimidinic site) lyase [Alphaproteobacteria bacterium]|nr:MAG: bifunctional DNA-formamidopyrimidine glycosylase/DNA-(apurinic or apyrimidinic site) lyase [Alphaproteobacteria bacterium]
MPELPEVQTLCTGLRSAIAGKRVERVLLFRENLRYPFPEHLAASLEGKIIEDVQRRAKYILMPCGSHQIIAHLGMSGSFTIRHDALANRHKHDHMIWQMEDGIDVVYHDPRRFGFVLLTHRDQWHTHPMITSLGVEPLEDECSIVYMQQHMRNVTRPIKTWLMDAHIIVGIGNIYASETLFRARIHPNTPTYACINHAEMLRTCFRSVLNDALASGGSTLRNYKNALGTTGYFQHKFQVYGREGQACFTCNDTIQNITHAGRSTFFCPSCQAEPSS